MATGWAHKLPNEVCHAPRIMYCDRESVNAEQANGQICARGVRPLPCSIFVQSGRSLGFISSAHHTCHVHCCRHSFFIAAPLALKVFASMIVGGPNWNIVRMAKALAARA